MLILAAVLVGAMIYLRRHWGELVASFEYRPAFLLPLAALELGLLVLRGLLTRRLSRIFGVTMKVVEATKLAAWTSFANYVTPFVGGTGLRAIYLRRQHGLPYTKFLSVQAATYTLHFMVSSAVGLVALFLLDGIETGLRNVLAVMLAGVFATCALLHRWPFPAPRSEDRISRMLRRVVDGWSEVRDAELTPLLSLLVANTVLQVAAISLAFALVGTGLRVSQALFIATLYSLSILIAITPASLGISEGAIVFSATVCGLAGPTALAAAALRRLVSFLVTALAAFVGSANRSDAATPRAD